MDTTAKKGRKTTDTSAGKTVPARGHDHLSHHLSCADMLHQEQQQQHQQQQGNSALHEAAWNGHSQAIEVLLKAKTCCVNGKNKNGFSPLHLACQQGHNQSARLLLWAGAKTDAKNHYGDSPLHTAARYGHAGVARILISAYCNVCVTNKNGDTPLHITAAMGRRKLTKILLESSCNPASKNKQGETAMDIALRKAYNDVQEIIANPPPMRPRQGPRPDQVAKVGATHHSQKKRDKSGSLGSESRTTDSVDKDKKSRRKKKSKLNGSSRSVQFIGDDDGHEEDAKNRHHHSPYGCPQSPDMSEFPKPKLNSLPSDPLRPGEQYFIDLAGNIQKGPVNRKATCLCRPLLDKVEKVLENDKQEIKEHIDIRHEELNSKISSLEHETKKELTSLNVTFQTKLACERKECIERNVQQSILDRMDFDRKTKLQVEQLKGDMRHWIHSNIATQQRAQKHQSMNNVHASGQSIHMNGRNVHNVQVSPPVAPRVVRTSQATVQATVHPEPFSHSVQNVHSHLQPLMMSSHDMLKLRPRSNTGSNLEQYASVRNRRAGIVEAVPSSSLTMSTVNLTQISEIL